MTMKSCTAAGLLACMAIPLAAFGGQSLNDDGTNGALCKRHPTFPYNATYQNGLSSVARDQEASVQNLRADWALWKSNWLASAGAGNGYRILFDSDGGTPKNKADNTVSEGLGYGMLFAVYFDEQDTFDQLYIYVKAHYNTHGLMGFKIGPDNKFITAVGGQNSATDADEDIAAALVFAASKWRASNLFNYRKEAVTLINNIMTYDVDSKGGIEGTAPTYALLGGDYPFTGRIGFNPSYFAPAWYRIFQKVTGDARWDKVVNNNYQYVSNCANKGTGLVPENCFIDGSPSTGQDHTYSYNAFRTPFRIALDHSWYGVDKGPAAQIGQFYAGVFTGMDYPTGILANRELDGTVDGNYDSPCFDAGAGAGFMAAGLQTDANNLLHALEARSDQQYYLLAWKLFGELYMTGNLPNLSDE